LIDVEAAELRRPRIGRVLPCGQSLDMRDASVKSVECEAWEPDEMDRRGCVELVRLGVVLSSFALDAFSSRVMSMSKSCAWLFRSSSKASTVWPSASRRTSRANSSFIDTALLPEYQ
jgi:hypothetical protein